MRGGSAFFEKVEVIGLSLFKFEDKEKEIDISKITCILGELSTGANTAEFMLDDALVLRLVFDYDKASRCGIVNSIMVGADQIDAVVAEVIGRFLETRMDLISLRSGFGDMGKVVDILSNHKYSALIRIQITSMDKKSIAITKSISKLQESFTEPKFSMMRLT